MDGLTTNGVLVMHPAGGFSEDSAPGVWREISVCGNVYTLRDSRSAQQRGKLVRGLLHFSPPFPGPHHQILALPCWEMINSASLQESSIKLRQFPTLVTYFIDRTTARSLGILLDCWDAAGDMKQGHANMHCVEPHGSEAASSLEHHTIFQG